MGVQAHTSQRHMTRHSVCSIGTMRSGLNQLLMPERVKMNPDVADVGYALFLHHLRPYFAAFQVVCGLTIICDSRCMSWKVLNRI